MIDCPDFEGLSRRDATSAREVGRAFQRSPKRPEDL
jgi:hypothetical protein